MGANSFHNPQREHLASTFNEYIGNTLVLSYTRHDFIQIRFHLHCCGWRHLTSKTKTDLRIATFLLGNSWCWKRQNSTLGQQKPLDTEVSTALFIGPPSLLSWVPVIFSSVIFQSVLFLLPEASSILPIPFVRRFLPPPFWGPLPSPVS